MRAQGQTPGMESFKGRHTSRAANQKTSSSSSRFSCPRAKRCSALEPVLEHFELSSCPAPGASPRTPKGSISSSPPPSPWSLLARLRDRYVKLMNELASGADFAGVSSFYGGGYGVVAAGENATAAMAMARRDACKETTRVGSARQTAEA